MTPIKIVIKGQPIVKKNTMGTTWFRNEKGKGGIVKKVPLKYPIKYYTKPYLEWAKKAVERCMIHKQMNMQNFPITEPVVISVVFFLKSDAKVDLSNLIEGIQDVLAGDSGLKLGKKLKHEDYQILEDDSQKYIKLENIMTFQDKLNPRTEVFISPFNATMIGEVLNNIHPGLKLTLGYDEEDLFEQAFPNGFETDKKWNTN